MKKNEPKKKQEESVDKPLIPKTPDAIDISKKKKDTPSLNYPFFPNGLYPTSAEEQEEKPDTPEGL